MLKISRVAPLFAMAAFSISGADLQSGVNAFDRGDYTSALKELKPFSRKGDSLAQVMLGLMYYQAKGVTQDYHEALRLFLLAADQGEGMAQLSIGFMYSGGQGVDRNFAQSYMRFTLCAATPEVRDNCIKNRELVKGQMTSAQIAEGERLIAAWKQRIGKK